MGTQNQEAIRSPGTREVCKRRLATFLEYAGADIDAFVGKAKKKPRWAQNLILNYLLKQNERALKKEIELGTLGNVNKPVKLLEMNDVSGINRRRATSDRRSLSIRCLSISRFSALGLQAGST